MGKLVGHVSSRGVEEETTASGKRSNLKQNSTQIKVVLCLPWLCCLELLFLASWFLWTQHYPVTLPNKRLEYNSSTIDRDYRPSIERKNSLSNITSYCYQDNPQWFSIASHCYNIPKSYLALMHSDSMCGDSFLSLSSEPKSLGWIMWIVVSSCRRFSPIQLDIDLRKSQVSARKRQ